MMTPAVEAFFRRYPWLLLVPLTILAAVVYRLFLRFAARLLGLRSD